MDRRKQNVKIFEDLMAYCKSDSKIMDGVKKTTEEQRLYLEDDMIEMVNSKMYAQEAKIVVSSKRTLEAAAEYKGKKVAVLNFASATNPGGGVTKGSSAQEECLCRCSTLYLNLNTKEMWDGFYSPHRASGNPIYNGDCIYTPDVLVVNCDTANPQRLKQEDRYKVNVITCAAPNLRPRPSNAMNPGAGNKPVKITANELFDIHVTRTKRVLEIAYQQGNEIVILGAWGCGAFQNDPFVVARAAKKALEEYKNKFEIIEFAVYCSPKDMKNFEIFSRVFK